MNKIYTYSSCSRKSLAMLIMGLIAGLQLLSFAFAPGAAAYSTEYRKSNNITTIAQPAEAAALITNVSASSGKSYVVTDLATGKLMYTDRTYQITSVPSALTGATLIETANDDKKSTSSSLLSFDLSEQSTIYVAYDPRATTLPSWLSGWQKLTDKLGVDDSQISSMVLYSKTFDAGEVTLGGNLASPAKGAETNYLIIAKQTAITPASTGLVTDVSASSGKNYVVTELAAGKLMYTDRTYKITTVPSSLTGATLIETANDDKKSTSTSLLSFNLSEQSVVYVAYDPRGTTLPSWLSGWQKLTDKLGVDDSQISNMDLYSKTFAAGEVVLGGNLASPAKGAQTNYLVIAKQTATPPTSTALVTGVVASSGKKYVVTDLAAGKLMYTDRTYKITTVPSVLTSATLIQTANDDKYNTSTSLLSFNLSEQSVVYVAYDPRGTTLPGWLSGWQKLTDRLGVDDSQISNMDLYSMSFPAGKVSLGGNLASPAKGAANNYLVIAKREDVAVKSLSFTTTSLNYTAVQGGTVSAQSTQLSASQGTPTITLSKTSATWLTLPNAGLGTVTFGSSNISTNLTPGTYQATVTASADGYTSASLRITLTVTAPPASSSEVNINFQLASTSTPSGYTADAGQAYSSARGYGWLDAATGQPKDITASMRQRSGTDELRLRTFAQMQDTPSSWEYAVPNGMYNVTVSAGDPSYFDSKHQVNVEGIPAISGFVPSSTEKYRSGTVTVEVKDGKLTIDAAGGQNTKLNYALISPSTAGSDDIAPIATVKLSGTLQSEGVYQNEVLVTINASDTGGSGLASVQYSLNSGAYTAYSAPIRITAVGNYTIRAKATDRSGNVTVSDVTSFSIEKAAASNTYMFVENADKFPALDEMTFSLIQIPWRRDNGDGTYTAYNANHNQVKLKISNKGKGTLIVSDLALSNNNAWKIESLNGAAYDASAATPFSVGPGASAVAVIEFIAKDQATRVKVLNDTLYIHSNDDLAPFKKVVLRGLWQKAGEGNNEPWAQEIIRAFGFKTRTGYSHDDGSIDGNTIVPNSDEIITPFFVKADPSKDIILTQMAAYHGCCAATEKIQWYAKNTSTFTTVFTHNSLDGQSLLPRKSGSSTVLAQGKITAIGAFGIRTGKSYSDRTKNFEGKLAMRIWKAVDSNGNVIPNAYIIGSDYLGTSFTNYDYQDNVYYITNVRPETGSANYSELAAAPSAVYFDALQAGSSKTMSISLSNSGEMYESGNDPAIQIKGVELVGPDYDEFSFTMPSATVLAAQASTSISVKFNPKTLGIKNAALLVHYNSGASPLRIPLYGIANTSSAAISLVKRIKGGSDNSITIQGNVWESDANYRKGSVRLDKQVVTTPIASTDEDVLYQTYLSAATDLAETRFEVPLANGSYRVRLHFVENYFSSTGARVFNTTIENSLQLANFDIYREVGYRAALVKDFEVNITDGVLNLKFNPTVNRLALAGVEIYKVTATSSLAAQSASESALVAEEDALGKQGQGLRLYPNPNAGDKVMIELNGFAPHEVATITMYDIAGRQVSSGTTETDGQGAAIKEMSIAGNASRGVYLIKAVSASGQAQSKLLIAR
ncbi:T9SS type A sorting domain-containing protein [Pontibacter sp. 172403-2]|uniref:malectin domain-containing carbohydrate-binding protein n=1 Tax=Pontibacter rufus TaxID=2791028 RepID=UPI0018B01338|nr:malectin domain-containing carbohydrate-binding protein [Pontibacter sp. 172403-2]MBF9254588.1 T9SS type A sorting domain-containing protein [Pontibacter sp. 172403-2]